MRDSPFRSIAQCKNELKQQECKVEVLEYSVEYRGDSRAERKRSVAVLIRRCSNKIHDDRCSQPKGGLRAVRDCVRLTYQGRGLLT